MANFCQHCGTPLSQEAAFCPNCGTPVGNIPQQPVQSQPQQPYYPPAPETYPQQAYQQPAYYQPPVQQPAQNTGKKKSTGLTVLIIVLVILLAAEGVVAGIWLPGFFTGGSGSVTPAASKTETATLTAENPMATLCGVTIGADSSMFGDGDLSAKVADKGAGVSEDGASYHEYDISLGDRSEYDAAAELTFPCGGDPEDYVILHEDHETGEWMPMIGFPDADNGSLTVYTDSFSNFRATLKVDSPLFYIKNEGRPDATVEVSPNYLKVLETLDKKALDEATEEFAADPLHYDVTAEKSGEEGSSAMSDLIVNASGPLADVVGNTAELDFTPVEFVLKDKTYEYYGSTFKSDLSSFMNGVTILNIGLQLTRDIHKHGLNSETTAANLMKNIMTNGSTIYSMATGYTSTAFTFTFFGVAMIGMGLDKMTDTAKSEQQKYMKKLMDIYYKEVSPFDADYWYKEVNRICRDDLKTTQEAINEVSALLDKKAAEFWQVMENQSGKEFESLMLEAGIKNIYSVPTSKKNELTAQVKNDFRKKFNEQVIPKIEKDILAKQQATLYTILKDFAAPFNRTLNFKVIERVDMETVFETRYNGCSIAFAKDKNIQTGEGWVLTAPESDDNDWDDGWEEVLTATDYAWICAGLPDTAYVYLSESDMKNNKDPLVKMHFAQPHATQSRTAEINLSESATYAYRLKQLSINPNYEMGDPEKVTSYSGDAERLFVYWQETVTENGAEVVKEYQDITDCSGTGLDFPSNFVFHCFYDDKTDNPSKRSQDSTVVARYDDTEKAFSKEGYYPGGFSGHEFKGDNAVPEAEEGGTVRIVVNRGIYTLVYLYECVPVDEKDYEVYDIVNNCKNEPEIEDFMGTWYMKDGKLTGYLTFELNGNKIKISVSDSLNHADSYTSTYKLENGKLMLYVASGELGATAVLKDKDHMIYTNTQVGQQVLTRQK